VSHLSHFSYFVYFYFLVNSVFSFCYFECKRLQSPSLVRHNDSFGPI
jgi:hypothetical protein